MFTPETMVGMVNLDGMTDGEMQAAAMLYMSLASYCVFGYAARQSRKTGKINDAVRFEKHMEAIYDSLPPEARW